MNALVPIPDLTALQKLVLAAVSSPLTRLLYPGR